MVPRDPTERAYTDSSLRGAGGISFELKFWWVLEWPDDIVRRTWLYKKQKGHDPSLITINDLEYAAIIITFHMVICKYHRLERHNEECPIILVHTGNMSAKK